MRACANDSGSSPDECTRSAANSVSEPTRRKRSNGRTEREQRADPTRLASDLLLCFHSRAIGVDPSKLGLEAHHDKAAARTADVKAEYEATDGGDGSQSQYAAAHATRRQVPLLCNVDTYDEVGWLSWPEMSRDLVLASRDIFTQYFI